MRIIRKIKDDRGGRWNVWHNTRGTADQYFICKGDDVKWQIPRWVGRMLDRRRPEDGQEDKD